MKKLIFSNAAAAGLIAGVCLFLFWRCLGLYFIQDDFSYLWATSDQSIHGLLEICATRTAGFYRPISNHLYFFIFQWLFGTNPFPYHLANLLIHITNSLAVGYMIYLLTESRRLAFVSSFIFASRIGHFIAVYWICVTTQSMTLMFFLLSFICYLHYWRNSKSRVLFLSYFLFALCAFSNINGPTFVFLFTAFDLLMRKETLSAMIKKEAPFYLVVALFLVVQFIVLGYDSHNEYQVNFTNQAVKNFGSLNVFAYNFLFLLDYYTQYPSNMIGLGIIIGMLTVAGIVILAVDARRRGLKMEGRLLLFFGFWYLWGFVPYLPLARHLWLGEYIWPQYITASATGLAFILAWALNRFLNPKLLASALCLILAVSYFSVRGFHELEHRTGGTVYKSELARNIIADLKDALERQPNARRIFIVNSTVDIWWILHYGRNLEVFTGVYRPIFHITEPMRAMDKPDSLVLRYEDMHLYRVDEE